MKIELSNKQREMIKSQIRIDVMFLKIASLLLAILISLLLIFGRTPAFNIKNPFHIIFTLIQLFIDFICLYTFIKTTKISKHIDDFESISTINLALMRNKKILVKNIKKYSRDTDVKDRIEHLNYRKAPKFYIGFFDLIERDKSNPDSFNVIGTKKIKLTRETYESMTPYVNNNFNSNGNYSGVDSYAIVVTFIPTIFEVVIKY